MRRQIQQSKNAIIELVAQLQEEQAKLERMEARVEKYEEAIAFLQEEIVEDPSLWDEVRDRLIPNGVDKTKTQCDLNELMNLVLGYLLRARKPLSFADICQRVLTLATEDQVSDALKNLVDEGHASEVSFNCWMLATKVASEDLGGDEPKTHIDAAIAPSDMLVSANEVSLGVPFDDHQKTALSETLVVFGKITYLGCAKKKLAKEWASLLNLWGCDATVTNVKEGKTWEWASKDICWQVAIANITRSQLETLAKAHTSPYAEVPTPGNKKVESPGADTECDRAQCDAKKDEAANPSAEVSAPSENVESNGGDQTNSIKDLSSELQEQESEPPTIELAIDIAFDGFEPFDPIEVALQSNDVLAGVEADILEFLSQRSAQSDLYEGNDPTASLSEIASAINAEDSAIFWDDLRTVLGKLEKEGSILKTGDCWQVPSEKPAQKEHNFKVGDRENSGSSVIEGDRGTDTNLVAILDKDEANTSVGEVLEGASALNLGDKQTDELERILAGEPTPSVDDISSEKPSLYAEKMAAKIKPGTKLRSLPFPSDLKHKYSKKRTGIVRRVEQIGTNIYAFVVELTEAGNNLRQTAYYNVEAIDILEDAPTVELPTIEQSEQELPSTSPKSDESETDFEPPMEPHKFRVGDRAIILNHRDKDLIGKTAILKLSNAMSCTAYIEGEDEQKLYFLFYEDIKAA